MSVNFRQQTDDLRELIERLKSRCLKAEAMVADLQRQTEEQQSRIAQLEDEKETLNRKYRNLQSGLAATGRDPEQVKRLKEQYLAMVSEIDACIATLQNG